MNDEYKLKIEMFKLKNSTIRHRENNKIIMINNYY